MAKKSKEKPQREVTKRQLARWQKQKRRQRILFGSGIFIIAAVLITIGVGWYLNQYRPLHQTVIRVNDTTFNMDYYVKALKFYGEGQPSYYMYSLADGVLEIIEQDELIRQEATELDITVSQNEVDKELKSLDPPLSRDYRDFVRAAMLIDKLQAEYFDEQVPVNAEQRHIMAMLLESESQVAEVKTRIEEGEDFAELAGELSLELFSKGENGDLGWRPEGILTLLWGTSIIDEYAFISEIDVLSQPIYDEEQIKSVGYWIAKVLERGMEPEEADVQGILFDSEEEAWEVRDRLETGEDFGELAQEFSQHESREDNGDLGWLAPGELGFAFDEFVFDLEIELGVVSEPIFDDIIAADGGYWLIKVSERKEEKQEKVDVQVILLGSEEEAQRVRDRLEAGEDFGELAKELSQHEGSKNDGGEVTGVTSDMMSEALSEFVFDLEVELETVSEPLRDDTLFTKGGYWLIKVVDKDDNRQIEDSDRELLKTEAFTEWVKALRDNPENDIENYLDAEMKAWAVDRAIGS